MQTFSIVTATLLQSLERHERDIVFLFPIASGERAQRVEALVDQVLASVTVLDDHLESWNAEHLAGRVVHLEQTVTEEQDTVAGCERVSCSSRSCRAWRRAACRSREAP